MSAIKRRLFLRKCLDHRLSAEAVMEFTNQMTGKSDDEKELLAEKFTKEIEEKFLPNDAVGDKH